MSPDVRVHLRLGAVRLEFEGDRSFYERHVEGLVDAASRSGRSSVPNAVSGNGKAPVAAPPTSDGDVAAPPPPPAPVERPRASFVPQSGEFGRFIRRLGPEAGEADRQVAAFAFYLWNYEKRETFGEPEIVGCFRALGLTPPTDLPALFDDLTDRRRFLEGSGSSTWRLSRKGENYVKTRLLAS
jgi:hypothetical protein